MFCVVTALEIFHFEISASKDVAESNTARKLVTFETSQFSTRPYLEIVALSVYVSTAARIPQRVYFVDQTETRCGIQSGNGSVPCSAVICIAYDKRIIQKKGIDCDAGRRQGVVFLQ